MQPFRSHQALLGRRSGGMNSNQDLYIVPMVDGLLGLESETGIPRNVHGISIEIRL